MCELVSFWKEAFAEWEVDVTVTQDATSDLLLLANAVDLCIVLL